MKPNRYNVKCFECKAIFNNDYRATHEKNRSNKRVGIKTLELFLKKKEKLTLN